MCAYAAGLLLDVLIISALLRNGAYRRFPFILPYVVTDFLTSVIEIQPGVAFSSIATAERKRIYSEIFWWNERVIQVLVFLIVLGMVYQATLGVRTRRTLLAGLIAATILFAGITFAIHFDPHVQTAGWIVHWTRDLNFGSAILDLVLWAILLTSRDKDTRLLMMAAGLGIQFTGAAIGHALMVMGLSETGQIIVGDLTYLTSLACLYIWWTALRQPRKAAPRTGFPQITEKTMERVAPK